jgi:hypothetical protein
MKRFGDPGADFQTFGNNKTGTESSQMARRRGRRFSNDNEMGRNIASEAA